MENLIKRRKFENPYIANGNFKVFPDEVIWKMFDFLDIKSLRAFCKTNPQMYTNCKTYMKLNLKQLKNQIEEEKLYQYFLYLIGLVINGYRFHFIKRDRDQRRDDQFIFLNGYFLKKSDIFHFYIEKYKPVKHENKELNIGFEFDIKINPNNKLTIINKDAYYKALHLFSEDIMSLSYHIDYRDKERFDSDFKGLDITNNSDITNHKSTL